MNHETMPQITQQTVVELQGNHLATQERLWADEVDETLKVKPEPMLLELESDGYDYVPLPRHLLENTE